MMNSTALEEMQTALLSNLMEENLALKRQLAARETEWLTQKALAE